MSCMRARLLGVIVPHTAPYALRISIRTGQGKQDDHARTEQAVAGRLAYTGSAELAMRCDFTGLLPGSGCET
jgi:hypothetical protein